MRSESIEFSSQSVIVFLFLQALDILTTMLGLRLGAGEGSAFISRLMSFGPVPALLLSKAISMILVTAVVAYGRGRFLRRLNLWYAGLVTWNLVIILLQAWL